MNIRGYWALITGAAGGLGAALAMELADRGAKLVLTDLDGAALAVVATRARARGAEVVCLEHDVTDAQRWREIAEQLSAGGRTPRMLFNNAGVAVAGRVLDIPDQSWETVIDVVLWGVIHGVRAMVPSMLEAGRRCAVVNVASASAYVGLPFGAPYFLAKAGVLSLTQTLQSEIDPKKVSFTCVCPGQVPTGMWKIAAGLGAGSPELMDRVGGFVEPRGRTPQQVAVRAIDGALAGRAVVNVFREAWLLDLAARILPHQMLAWISRRSFVWGFPELV
jgi:short-subunit dehydrogenase